MDFFLETNNLMLIATAVLSGLMLMWPSIQNKRAGQMVEPIAAVQMMNHQDALIVDIRAPGSFDKGRIPQSRNIPVKDFETRLEKEPKDKPIIVVCDRGQLAVGAAAKLRESGFTQVSVLKGGLSAWVGADLPTTTKR